MPALCCIKHGVSLTRALMAVPDCIANNASNATDAPQHSNGATGGSQIEHDKVARLAHQPGISLVLDKPIQEATCG
eukprot:4807734-Amphidinium_carterae.1